MNSLTYKSNNTREAKTMDSWMRCPKCEYPLYDPRHSYAFEHLGGNAAICHNCHSVFKLVEMGADESQRKHTQKQKGASMKTIYEEGMDEEPQLIEVGTDTKQIRCPYCSNIIRVAPPAEKRLVDAITNILHDYGQHGTIQARLAFIANLIVSGRYATPEFKEFMESQEE